MSSLSLLTNDQVTECFKKYGVFIAFSDYQFEREAEKGVDYVLIPEVSGMFCPKESVSDFLDELNDIYEKGIEKDVEINGMENIIIYQLKNYECYYTGNIEDAVDCLVGSYPTTREEIEEVYKKTRHLYS